MKVNIDIVVYAILIAFWLGFGFSYAMFKGADKDL